MDEAFQTGHTNFDGARALMSGTAPLCQMQKMLLRQIQMVVSTEMRLPSFRWSKLQRSFWQTNNPQVFEAPSEKAAIDLDTSYALCGVWCEA